MRQPSLFVRSLRLDEARKLKQVRDRSKQLWRRQRAGILLASHTEMSVKQIAELYDTDESQVRRVIREFNEQGFKTLDPIEGGGRPRRIDDGQRDTIVAVALARPRDLGVPIIRWSLRRMAEHLASKHRIYVSAEHLRRILKEEGITYQKTRTWKESPDPDYEQKKNR
ncbi:MAG: helix-turn-helix domain-containing protein, partial [Gammaproteobacteria bacterium]